MATTQVQICPRLLSVSVVANNLHVCLFSSREARNIFLLVIACHSTKFDPFSCPSMKIIAWFGKWSFPPLMTENLTQEHARHISKLICDCDNKGKDIALLGCKPAVWYGEPTRNEIYWQQRIKDQAVFRLKLRRVNRNYHAPTSGDRKDKFNSK